MSAATLFVVFITATQSPLTEVAGDRERGRALFDGKGACASCHATREGDGRRAPSLSWIGLLRTADSLRDSLVDPAKHPPTPAMRLSSDEVDQLVAYLGSLRAIPPSYPRERTRTIPPASENVAFFDRPERAGEEASDALVNALEIRDGARVADLGAGTGYFTWRLARRVGATGKVIAVDIQPRMLELAAAAVKAHGLANVDFVLARPTDPRLPEGSLDVVFIAHSYHEFAEPETIMDAVRRSLKRGGRLVIVEYAKEKRSAPAASLHKMSFDEIRSEIEPMGFELERILDFLPVQHGLIFSVR